MEIHYLTGRAAKIDAADRGLAYGDGLFETMSVRNRKIERLDLHIERLSHGAAQLQLPLPEPGELRDRLGDTASTINRGLVKLIVTRGSGDRGYAPPARPVPTVIMTASTHQALPPLEIAVATLRLRLGENEALAGIKHLCRLEQVLGRLELESHGSDEGLMLSRSGKVIGGTSRNLFAVLGGRLLTPDLSRAGIRGVMRTAVIRYCQEARLPVEEAEIGPTDLLRADELFMTNALVGIQSVTRLDETTYFSRKMATRLRDGLGLNANA